MINNRFVLKYIGFISPVLFLILSIAYFATGRHMQLFTPVAMSVIMLFQQFSILTLINAVDLYKEDSDKSKWIACEDQLPPDETPVLIFINGKFRIGERRWDHPGHEDTYESYWYWDDPEDDGQDWERDAVTHWKVLE